MSMIGDQGLLLPMDFATPFILLKRLLFMVLMASCSRNGDMWRKLKVRV